MALLLGILRVSFLLYTVFLLQKFGFSDSQLTPVPFPLLFKSGINYQFNGTKLAAAAGSRHGLWKRASDKGDGTKVYGGTDANHTAYMLSLQLPSGAHKCGGVILTPRFALTAAHCFDKLSSPAVWRVVAGKLDLSKDEKTEQIRRIKRIHIHHGYHEPPQIDNDIAVIELLEPLNFKAGVVGSIEWKHDDMDNSCFYGEEGTAFGWGLTEHNTSSSVLKQVVLPIVTNNVCQKQYRKARIPRNITDAMLCAGQRGSGRDTCKGDSGGPLIVDTLLVGITSFGQDCGGNYAGVYTRVSAFTRWIKSTINSKSAELVDGSVEDGSGPKSAAFMLSLQLPSGAHTCGGVILSPRFALSAAHCFDHLSSPKVWRVVAGELDLSKDEGNEQVRGIKRIHIHPEYAESPQWFNNIALLELDEPLNFKAGVVDSIGWKDDNKDPSFYDGKIGTAFGWGIIGDENPANVLKNVQLNIITNTKCQEQYWKAKIPKEIRDNMLCAMARTPGRDTCRGDSGGPIFVGTVFVGITSFGEGCGKDHAGVYTRISAFTHWIQTTINSKSEELVDDNIEDGTGPKSTAFMLSLQKTDGSHLCGGVIIGPRFALTAAQCFEQRSSPADWRVAAGELDFSKDEGTEQVRGIKRIHVHPEYSGTPQWRNDIALVELDEPFNFKAGVVDAIEWKDDNMDSSLYSGKIGTAFGWGIIGDEKSSSVLKNVGLKILTKTLCQEQYHKTRSPKNITDTMICAMARTPGRDTCQGDSGGPLIVGTVLVGITSYGEGCGKNHAGVYTRVSAFTHWIQSRMDLKSPAVSTTTSKNTPAPASTTTTASYVRPTPPFDPFGSHWSATLFNQPDYGGNQLGLSGNTCINIQEQAQLLVRGSFQNSHLIPPFRYFPKIRFPIPTSFPPLHTPQFTEIQKQYAGNLFPTNSNYLNFHTKSVDPGQGCVRLYTGKDCIGNNVAYESGSRCSSNISECGQSGRVQSIGPC